MGLWPPLAALSSAPSEPPLDHSLPAGGEEVRGRAFRGCAGAAGGGQGEVGRGAGAAGLGKTEQLRQTVEKHSVPHKQVS